MGHHVGYPLTISLIKDMQATWPGDFDAVEMAHCRGDVPIGFGPPWLYLWFGIQSGHMVAQPAGHFAVLFDRSVAYSDLWYDTQLTDPPDLACINDDFEAENMTLFNTQRIALEAYLEKA